MSGEDKTQDLRQRRKEARQSGGPERIAARQRSGAMSARERVEKLLDPDTFVELDVFIKGAVTGHGMIEGRSVYVFAQDGDEQEESQGEALDRKVGKVWDLALANGAPLVGLYDSDPGTVSGLSFRAATASGVVPQIAAIMGEVSGSAACAPMLADLVVMVKGGGQLYLGDTAAVKAKGLENLAGARALSEQGGVAHIATDDEAGCLETVRKLLSYLPQNNLGDAPQADWSDPVDRMDAELDALAGAEDRDVLEVVTRVIDKDSFVQLLPQWGTRMAVGFARLGGRSVGVVANQTVASQGLLDADSTAKAARFVRLCDAFNVPLISLVDSVGFESSDAAEQGRALREASKLQYAYAEATVPKLTVVIGSALAEGFEVMCPKHLKTDMSLAWPSAQVGVSAESGSPYAAAEAGHLDDVIEPVVTRPRLVAALEASASKRETRPAKKHGNIVL